MTTPPHVQSEIDPGPDMDARDRDKIDHHVLPGFYEVLYGRRDVRAEFSGAPADTHTLFRVLEAAHAAPSVGLTQPWDFIVVTDSTLRKEFWHHVQTERANFDATLDPEASERFRRIKIDGILESSLSIVVTYDPSRGSPAVLGRHAIADAGLYSVCLAIQNLWLACTAEGWGVGWVSFYREEVLQDMLDIPADIRPIAWLCIGPVEHLQTIPDLERHGWRMRAPLDAVIHQDIWDARTLRSMPDEGPSTLGGALNER